MSQSYSNKAKKKTKFRIAFGKWKGQSEATQLSLLRWNCVTKQHVQILIPML